MKKSNKPKISRTDLKPIKKLISKLESYKKKTQASYSEPKTLSQAGYSKETYMEVEDLPAEEVEKRIERLVIDIGDSIMKKIQGGYAFNFPSRASKNSVYLKDLKRFVLQYKGSRCSYTSPRSTVRAVVMSRMLEIVYQLLRSDVRITKRDLFYSDVKLFENQTRTDDALEDMTCMVGCSRNNLFILAAERGVIIGHLTFLENGDKIDCRKMGNGGKAISPDIDCVKIVESDALFILIVEKDTVFIRLAQIRFYERHRCIIITAKGYPDMATRSLVHKLYRELKIPIFALTDCDPHGLHIASVYRFGSKAMSYDSGRLATPNIIRLGLKFSDLDTFGVPKECRLSLTDKDISLAESLLMEGWIEENEDWKLELKDMLKYKKKAEIECLSSFDFNYLTDVYLPRQLYNSIGDKST